MPRRRQKALPPVKVGSVSIPRYQLGDGRVMITYPTATKRRECRTFVKASKAASEAHRIARELHNGGAEAAIFSAADRADLSQAQRDVARYGVAVHVATGEWSRAKVAINGRAHSVAEVVAAGLKALARAQHPVAEVVAEVIASKARVDLHERYRVGMNATFRKFAEAFPCDIRDVKSAQITRWLDGTTDAGVLSGGWRKRNGEPVGPRRRDNILRDVRLLFQFARLHGYLADEISEAKKVPLIDEGGGEISYFTVPEMRLILDHVRPAWRPVVVLIVFNGFRTEELIPARQSTKRKDPLRWEDFDWDENEICVREDTSKVHRKRVVPLHEATREWLAQDRRERGLICAETRLDKEFGRNSRLERVINRVLAGSPRLRDTTPIQLEIAGLGSPEPEMLTSFAWRHNALRHSYGSYRASILKNVNELAEEMGTSPEMIHKHYRNPRPTSQARAWFALRPPKTGNIVPFPGQISASA